MRVIFLGTPEFAVPTLKALINEPDFDVVAVVCQPDRPKGRGNKVVPPPVKEVAEQHGIRVLQPEKLSKAKDMVEEMRQLQPDVIVMVAFGQILKEPVLTMAPMGVINLHGSVLPRYRGAAPINWSIINGETKCGVTTMKTDAGVDTGPMLLKHEVDIDENMTAPELSEKLSHIGAPLIVETLRRLKSGTLQPETQNDAESNYAPMLKKEMGEIDWRRKAKEIHNLVRGLQPWPGTWANFRGTQLKISKTGLTDSSTAVAPGTIVISGKDIIVACGPDGVERLKLITVRPQGKPDMEARNWANGARLTQGERFDNPISESGCTTPMQTSIK